MGSKNLDLQKVTFSFQRMKEKKKKKKKITTKYGNFGELVLEHANTMRWMWK